MIIIVKSSKPGSLNSTRFQDPKTAAINCLRKRVRDPRGEWELIVEGEPMRPTFFVTLGEQAYAELLLEVGRETPERVEAAFVIWSIKKSRKWVSPLSEADAKKILGQ